jgi:hypothetical protein
VLKNEAIGGEAVLIALAMADKDESSSLSGNLPI